MTVYGRYSIACWVDPVLPAEPRSSEDYDDKRKMNAEVRRLLKKGHFKSIITYEWNSEIQDWVEIGEFTSKNLPD